MRNKGFIIFSFFCTAVLLAGMSCPLYAQQQSKKEKDKAAKEEKIKVPQSALEPKVSKEDFEKQLKAAVDAFSPETMPRSLAAFRKNGGESFSPGAIRHNISQMKLLASHEDIEEVTQYPRTWYAQMYNVTIQFYPVTELFDQALMSNKDGVYIQAMTKIVSLYKQLVAIKEKPPKKLTEEQLKEIKKQNRERRKEHYIKWYKEQQEKKKELEKQMTAEGNKKDKKADNKKKPKK